MRIPLNSNFESEMVPTNCISIVYTLLRQVPPSLLRYIERASHPFKFRVQSGLNLLVFNCIELDTTFTTGRPSSSQIHRVSGEMWNPSLNLESEIVPISCISIVLNCIRISPLTRRWVEPHQPPFPSPNPILGSKCSQSIEIQLLWLMPLHITRYWRELSYTPTPNFEI